jgi:hypothetical protein
MPNATGECPPSTDPVPTVDGDRVAAGHKGASGPGHVAMRKDLGNGLLHQKRPRACNRRRPNQRTPACGGINVRERLQDLKLGHQIGFGPPQDGGKLQGKEPGVVECLDSGLREGGLRFRLIGSGHHSLPHGFDGRQEGRPFLLATRGQCLAHSCFSSRPSVP